MNAFHIVLKRSTLKSEFLKEYLLSLFIVLFAKNCTDQIKSNYLDSHGEEAQEKPPGL